MMFRLIAWMFGWKRFSVGMVTVFQKNVLINQLVIRDSLEATRGLRRWCDDEKLTIYIEDKPFSGGHGTTARAELSRFRRFGNSASLTICADNVTHESMTELLRGLGRVD